MTSTHIAAITFDTSDAQRAAVFWAAVLGWDVGPDASEDFAVVGGPNRPRDMAGLMFFKVPEGKTAKNRNHLDLHTTDLAGEVERLVGLGATIVHEKHEWDTHWYTLHDPDGNELCLVEEGSEVVADG